MALHGTQWPYGTQWHSMAPSDTQRQPMALSSPMAPNDTQWHSVAVNGTQWHPVALWHSIAPNGTQWYPMAPSGPMALNGTQWHSMAPSGTQWPYGTQWHPVALNGTVPHPWHRDIPTVGSGSLFTWGTHPGALMWAISGVVALGQRCLTTRSDDDARKRSLLTFGFYCCYFNGWDFGVCCTGGSQK